MWNFLLVFLTPCFTRRLRFQTFLEWKNSIENNFCGLNHGYVWCRKKREEREENQNLSLVNFLSAIYDLRHCYVIFVGFFTQSSRGVGRVEAINHMIFGNEKIRASSKAFEAIVCCFQAQMWSYPLIWDSKYPQSILLQQVQA